MADSNAVSISSYEEFQKTFYPKWYELQQASGNDESFGRDLARYSVQRHFPSPEGSAVARAKKRS
jgi:hypothetical protein